MGGVRLDARNTVVFDGAALRIGEYRCAPGDEAWGRENVAEEHYVVFPRVAVEIAPAARRGGGARGAVVADPNWVMFYNPGQAYRRRALCARGDECEWFRVREDLLRGASAAFDPGVSQRDASALFPFTHGPGGAGEYLRQRRVYREAVAGGEALEIEEAFLGVLGAVLGAAYRFRGAGTARAERATDPAHARAAEAAKELLGVRFRERLTLDVVSDGVGLSPYHLCRVFRAHTGISIHNYVTRLRVRAVLERLEAGALVGEAALWGGFSSHGHFTGAFGREFGVTPSRAKGWMAAPGPARRGLG